MKITCIDKEIKRVFESGYYSIPRFQRPYSWERDQIKEFWDDVVNGANQTYFIGSIVLYKMGDNKLGIVDGQQRLTTITMLLCALRNAYRRFDLNLAEGLQNYIEKKTISNQNSFILLTETSYPYFQEYIQKFEAPDISIKYKAEENSLKNGFEQISKYISETIDIGVEDSFPKLKPIEVKKKIKLLNEIRDKVLELKVIYIELEDEDDAYVIFETLNTRGKDLSVGDLLKNFVTQNIKASNQRVDTTKDKWTNIKENIELAIKDTTKDNIDIFLLHVWLSKYDFTTLKTLFQKLKKRIKPREAKMFLDELVTDSGHYKDIMSPSGGGWNKTEKSLKNSLESLVLFNVTQQSPLVLSIVRKYRIGDIRLKIARDLLRTIENFHLIFTAVTSQRSSGGVASMYSTIARKLHDTSSGIEVEKIARELRTKMNEKLPTYEEFLASFKRLRYTRDYTKDKKIIHYILMRVDQYLNEGGTAIDYSQMTIEHLLPQRPPGVKSAKNFYISSIGNLLLIDSKINGKLANKGFEKKKAILSKSTIHLDDVVKNANEWDNQSIEDRTNYLATLAYHKVFKIH